MEIEVAKHRGGGSGGVPAGGGNDFTDGTFLVWKDLTVVIPNFRNQGPSKKLLHGINGYAEPGRLMAIMGPSGSGKSTLLDSLAGRLSTNVVMTGDILINGKNRRQDGIVAYVTQEDVLLGTLTVKETITYSALLRFPNSMSREEIDGIVEGTIMEMGLQDCANRMIGTWHLRGVSGGEKKRVSIALEILTRPRLLFLDEPTSGLDSASAFFIIQTLRSVARDGKTVISSIHQPSSEVFTLFDDLFLLSSGEVVYFGDAKMAIEFFAEAGVPCPSKRNPSDHFLRCVNSDFDTVTTTLKGSLRYHENEKKSADPLANFTTTEIKARLIEKYKHSKYAKRARARTLELETNRDTTEMEKSSQASWFQQLWILTRRSSVNMSRDVGYYWLRIITYTVVSLCVGTIFFSVGTSYTAVLARGACSAFIMGFMSFMSIGGFPSFVEELKIYTRERQSRHYGVGAFILANFLSSFPFLVAVSVATGTITYFTVKMHPGFSHYAYFVLTIFLSISGIESLMMVIATLVPNFLMGLVTGAGVIGIMMMASGFFRLLPDLPKPFWRYPVSFLSIGAWSVQGSLKNDYLGLEFDAMYPGQPRLTGKYILSNIYGIPLHSKWWDSVALVALIILYRLLFFGLLKFKESASPLFHKLYAKKVIGDLKKRPSFRKVPSLVISSNRHHSFHSLSSQDGLNS